MFVYLVKRLFTSLITFFGITLITFFIIHLAPGSPVSSEDAFNPRITPEFREKLVKMYGLDKPLYEQYWMWLKGILHFDLGRSFSIDRRPVWDKIKERLPVTVGINLLALFFILLFAIPLGVYSALHSGKPLERVINFFTLAGYAMPNFWLALLLIMLFSVKFHLLPVSGLHSTIGFEKMGPLEKFLDVAKHLVCPLLVATFGGIAGISRYVRNSMYEVMHKEFILFARAKGISERRVIYRHALKNALLPLITILGLSIPGLIGGSVIFESIFAIPGIGQLMWQAVLSRDYPLIMGNVVLVAILTLLGNLIADLAYMFVDPRIKLQKK